MELDSMPIHEAYPLLLGARRTTQEDLEKKRAEWGENPTKRQRKILDDLKQKVAEFDCRIAAIEAFIIKKCVTHGHTN